MTIPLFGFLLIVSSHLFLRLWTLFGIKIPIFRKFLRFFEYSLYLHYINVVFLDVTIASLYGFLYGSMALTAQRRLATTLAAGFCLVLILVWLISMLITTHRHRFSLAFATQSYPYSAVVHQLRKDQVTVAYFYVLSLSLRFLSALVLVLLEGSFLLQTLLLAGLELGLFLYVGVVRPYAQAVVRKLHVMAEISTFLAVLVLVILAATDLVAWVAWVALALLVLAALCLFLMPVSTLVLHYVPRIHRLLEVRISPLPFEASSPVKRVKTLEEPISFSVIEKAPAPPNTAGLPVVPEDCAEAEKESPRTGTSLEKEVRGMESEQRETALEKDFKPVLRPKLRKSVLKSKKTKRNL